MPEYVQIGALIVVSLWVWSFIVVAITSGNPFRVKSWMREPKDGEG